MARLPLEKGPREPAFVLTPGVCLRAHCPHEPDTALCSAAFLNNSNCYHLLYAVAMICQSGNVTSKFYVVVIQVNKSKSFLTADGTSQCGTRMSRDGAFTTLKTRHRNHRIIQYLQRKLVLNTPVAQCFSWYRSSSNRSLTSCGPSPSSAKI